MHSLLEALRFLLLRDLRSLDQQVAAYPDDDSLWITAPGISNSAGNLVLHLTGNLRHFFGGVLGNTGYIRNRPAEFGTKGLSREALRREIAAAIDDIEVSIGRIDPAQLDPAYPIAIAERQVRTADFLAHLAVHLTYHLGQIDYHRRLLTPNPLTVENVAVRELPEA